MDAGGRNRAVRLVLTAAACLVLVGCSSIASTPGGPPNATTAGVVVPTCPSQLAAARSKPFIASPYGSAANMVPFTISYVVSCRYFAPSGAAGLVGSKIVTSRLQLAALRVALNSYTLIPPGEEFPCPFAGSGKTGEVDLYVGSAAQTEKIVVSANGCQFPTTPYGWYNNPRIDSPLLDQLLSLPMT